MGIDMEKPNFKPAGDVLDSALIKLLHKNAVNNGGELSQAAEKFRIDMDINKIDLVADVDPKEEIKRLAKALLRYMGGSEHSTISYGAINGQLAWRKGVTPSMIDRVIAELTAADYIFEMQGVGLNNKEFGQRLRPKGRRMARHLRGER